MENYKSSLPYSGKLKDCPKQMYMARLLEKSLHNDTERELWCGWFLTKQDILDHFNDPFYQKVISYGEKKYRIYLLGYRLADRTKRFKRKTTTYSKF